MLGWHGAVSVWLTVGAAVHQRDRPDLVDLRRRPLLDRRRRRQGLHPELAAEAVPVRDAPQIAVQSALDTAHGAGLTGLLIITPPAGPDGPITVAENAATWPDPARRRRARPYTGQITETVLWRGSPCWQLTRIGILAHMGSLFGLVSRLALAAMASSCSAWFVFLAGDAAAGMIARRRAAGGR